MSTTARRLYLIRALNCRGMKSSEVNTLLHRYSQERVARQIDYYDFELIAPPRLPLWAATPWLSHRIRRDVNPPRGYKQLLPGALASLRKLPLQQGKRHSSALGTAAGASTPLHE